MYRCTNKLFFYFTHLFFHLIKIKKIKKKSSKHLRRSEELKEVLTFAQHIKHENGGKGGKGVMLASRGGKWLWQQATAAEFVSLASLQKQARGSSPSRPQTNSATVGREEGRQRWRRCPRALVSCLNLKFSSRSLLSVQTKETQRLKADEMSLILHLGGQKWKHGRALYSISNSLRERGVC